MAIELSTPSFKPREYEGEHISYTLYGLDSDGDELDDLITSPKKGTITHTIKELLPDYRRVYSGMHVVAILYDENDRMLDSEVVWSTDQNEANGANEAAGEPSDVKDIAAYIKSLDPQTAPMYDAFGNKTGTVSFPKWYGDTKKLLFPCKFYSDADMNKIIKQGDEFISKKFEEGAYELTLEKVFSNAFHSNCYAVRIKPAVKEASGANETIEYEKGHKNSRGEDAPWVIRDHKNGKVLASFSKKDDAEAHLERMKHYSKGEKLFNKQELESMAMNGYKAAVTAAWSGAGVKNFKIDIRTNEEEPPTIDVWPKTLDGKDLDVSWRILPKIFKIAQYSISPVGNHDIEREMDFRTEDDIENIFTDEFKNLDAVMDDGKPAKTETAPDDYARNSFLEDALDYAELSDDNGNVTLLKFYKNKYSDDFKLDSYDGENQKTLAAGGLRYVVDRYGELLDMEPAEAIIEIAKE